MLSTHEVWTKRDEVRRPVASAIPRALARAGNSTLSSTMPEEFVDGRVEYTVDVYENRLLKAFIEELLLRAKSLRNSALAKNLSSSVDDLTNCIEALELGRHRAWFLLDVSPLSFFDGRPSMVFIRRRDYRSAYEAFLEYHRSLTVKVLNDELDAPIENLPSLYEYWCSMQVIEALAVECASLGYAVVDERLFVRDRDELFIRLLPTQGPTIELRHPALGSIALYLQRSYRRNSKGFKSVSMSQVPDIAIHVRRPQGKEEILIFDPKYKLVSENAPTSDEVEDEPELPSVGVVGCKPKKSTSTRCTPTEMRSGTSEATE